LIDLKLDGVIGKNNKHSFVPDWLCYFLDNILCAQAAQASTLLATSPKSRPKGPAL